MENYVKKTRGENEDTIKKLGNLRANLSAKEEEIKLLKEKTNLLEEQQKSSEEIRIKLETSKHALEEKTEQIRILSEQATIAADADKYKVENAELRGQFESLREKFESEEASNVRLKDELKSKDEAIAILESKRHGEVDQLRQRLDFLLEENDDLKVSQARAMSPLIAEINTLQNEILCLKKNDKESTVLELEKKNDYLLAALAKATEEIEALTYQQKMNGENEQEYQQIVKSLQEVIKQKDKELTEKGTQFSLIRDEQRCSKEIIDNLKNELDLLKAETSKKEVIEVDAKKKEEPSASTPKVPRSGVIVNSSFARNFEYKLKKAEDDLEVERAARLAYENECLSLTEQIANLRLKLMKGPSTIVKNTTKENDGREADILFLKIKNERDEAIAKFEDAEEALRLYKIEFKTLQESKAKM
eukprot:GHVP01049411.1.p1 GENE.GHVP01049411.1~~GHVP01049411.1.p1  ORF type:complete len:419 (+),score=125.32 GHVP01049411.1:403-1659(+)